MLLNCQRLVHREMRLLSSWLYGSSNSCVNAILPFLTSPYSNGQCGRGASRAFSLSDVSSLPDIGVYEDLFIEPERRDLESYRRAFDRISIPDSLERIVNQHLKIRLTGAEAIYRMLVVRGVRQVFGYSGGAVLPLIDQFHADRHAHIAGPSIKFINVAHEQTAAHAAQAVGRITGRPGIVIVTSGPGLTNCLTGIQDAYMDGDPMLVLSGQVPTSVMGTGAFQECPATALTKPCTKWNYLAEDIESLPWAMDTALRISMSGRKGPVHIDLPKNILAGEGDVPVPLVCPGGYRDLGENAARRSNARLLADFDESALEKVAERLQRCQRPVIIAGHGAVDAYENVRALAVKCDIPVTTTLHGMGIFNELHPLSLHMLGMHGSAYANLAVQSADLILALGVRFDDRTTGTLNTYAPTARKAAENGTGGIVHFDIESRQIGNTVKADIAILADCSYSIQRLLEKASWKRHTGWLQEIAQWKEKYPFQWINDQSEGTLKTQQAIDALYRASLHPAYRSLQKEISICTGVGNHQMMTSQFFRWTRPKQLVTSGGLGTMGSGLPFAIGTQFAYPDNTVLLIDGDGSFNMSSPELAAVTEFNLPIKIAIMNDGQQQMVRAWQHLFFDKRFIITNNANPDYVKLADSYNIPAVRCEHESQLEDVAMKLLMSDGPMLVEFRVVGDFCLPMVKPGSALHEMLLSKDEILGVSKDDPRYSATNAPS